MVLRLLFLSLVSFLSISSTSQATWSLIESSTDHDLRCIDFLDAQIGYAAGQEVLLKTTNGGLTWAEVVIDSINGWSPAGWVAYDIEFFTESYGRMVIGQYASFVETFDGGHNWTSIETASGGLCYFGTSYFFDQDNGFVAGHGCFESGIIDRLVNGQWETTVIPPNLFGVGPDLVTAIDFIDQTTGAACTDAGRILLTTDGGQTWSTANTDADNYTFTDIAYMDSETIYATHSDGQAWGILKSTDGGESFIQDNETATFYYPEMWSVHISGSGASYFGGEWGLEDTSGLLIDTEGSSLNAISMDHPLRDIDSYGDSIVFAVGDDGAIYTNTDPTTLGLSDVYSNQLSIDVFPNPTSDIIGLDISGSQGVIEGILLFDSSGKHLPVSPSVNGASATIDVRHLAKGSYHIRLVATSGRSTATFVKE